MKKFYSKIKVIIADDHEMVREGLQIMLSKIENVELIGEAVNGHELIQLTKELQPDVLLVDVKMPKCNGIEATKKIKAEYPHIGIVAISSFDEEYLIMDMLNAGAKGYLLKNASREEITNAILAVYRDETYYGRDVAEKLARMITNGGLVRTKKKEISFSENEVRIIQLICQGKSSKQISDIMQLKLRTVESYRSDILKKTEVPNMAGLVSFAIKNGLYTPGKK